MSSDCLVVNATNGRLNFQNEGEVQQKWTTAKIEKIALYSFAGLSAALGAASVGLGAAGIVASSFAFASIPLTLVAGALIFMGSRIRDYENLQELQGMRREAIHLSYGELVAIHGLVNICKYDIVSSGVLEEKRRYEEELNSLSSRRLKDVQYIESKYSDRQSQLLNCLYREKHDIQTRIQLNLQRMHRGQFMVFSGDGSEELMRATVHQEQGMIPVEVLLGYQLKDALQKVESKIAWILNQKIGFDQEILYQKEIEVVESNYNRAREIAQNLHREKMKALIL